MFTFLSFLLGIIFYIVGAGVTHGYAKHRWPPKIVRRQVYVTGNGWEWRDQDDNSGKREASTFLWPFYWLFIWPFTKTNEVTFSHIEKQAALQVAKNKTRVADLQATREELEASNAELEQAEVELEKEISNV
jgi:hypothetical protein